ncbi:MAG: hypothetical protein WCO60_20225 [Verrucomicrobiota bacterium]
MPDSELHPDLTPADVAAAVAALREDSPTQFAVDTMRKNGGLLPQITTDEINDLFTTKKHAPRTHD